MKVQLALVGFALIAVSVLFMLVLMIPGMSTSVTGAQTYEVRIDYNTPEKVASPSRFLLVQFHDDVLDREQQELLREERVGIVRDGGRNSFIVGVPEEMSPLVAAAHLARRSEVLLVTPIPN